MLDKVIINGKEYKTGMALKSDLDGVRTLTSALVNKLHTVGDCNRIYVRLNIFEEGEVIYELADSGDFHDGTWICAYCYEKEIGSYPNVIYTDAPMYVKAGTIVFSNKERTQEIGVVLKIEIVEFATKGEYDATVGSDPKGKTLHEKVDELYQSVGKDPQNPLSEDSTPRTLHWKVSELAAIVASWIVEKWEVFSGKFDSFKADWDSRKDTLAKQGDNPEATNSAILEEVKKVVEVLVTRRTPNGPQSNSATTGHRPNMRSSVRTSWTA